MSDEKYTYKKVTCDICGKEFQARYREAKKLGVSVYLDNTISITKRIDDGWETCDGYICEECACDILDQLKKNSCVNGEK